MWKKVYGVELTDDERQELSSLIHGGVTRARMVTRAQILLHAMVHPDGECGVCLLHGGCPASLRRGV
jgi:hypothetical protein